MAGDFESFNQTRIHRVFQINGANVTEKRIGNEKPATGCRWFTGEGTALRLKEVDVFCLCSVLLLSMKSPRRDVAIHPRSKVPRRTPCPWRLGRSSYRFELCRLQRQIPAVH